MKYHVFGVNNEWTFAPCRLYPGEFVAEHVYEDGRVDMVRFSGPYAERDCRNYALYRNKRLQAGMVSTLTKQLNKNIANVTTEA